MHINPFLFILPRSPATILWDYKNHQQFELTPRYQNRFFRLVKDISIFDDTNEIDAALLKYGVLIKDTGRYTDWGWDILSKIYHIGTKDIPYENTPIDENEWATHYLAHCDEVLSTSVPCENFDTIQSPLLKLPLPSNSLCHLNLTDALTQRATRRVFLNRPVTLENISTLLYFSLGYLKERNQSGNHLLPADLCLRRSSPSGGGLNSAEGYLYARNVEGLKPGVYYYNPKSHALSLLNCSNQVHLGELLSGQHFSNNLPFGIFLTSRFDKMWWKYEHSRAYRMALIEVGHISQTFQLVATALGLSTWLTGAINESSVEKIIPLPNPSEQLLFFRSCRIQQW
ncbi:SagB/ThcOx family dehydrogenase [Pseudomonas sp. LS1212]|uniref:SagB/ThcOx family dehydrogenase n=1 Tax=Pseudomonas sp. LS1212 TaxID=2972478 RepID=UPI002852D3D6|nr:SagB/ThcOx family dehydrogenase [Pseudomonas sp. LS1212]